MLSWLLTSFTHKLLSDGGRCPAASFPLLGQHCFSETSPKADAAQSSVCPFSGPPPQPLGVLVFRTGTTDGSLYCSSVLLGQSEWLWRNKASPRQICHGTVWRGAVCGWRAQCGWCRWKTGCSVSSAPICIAIFPLPPQERGITNKDSATHISHSVTPLM